MTAVDYLSFSFNEFDLHQCWRNATKHKDSIINGRRLENASWRKFFQMKFGLKTIDPATLNWQKDSDVCWLYGPFHSYEPLPVLQAAYQTENCEHGAECKVERCHNHGKNLKSALKKKTVPEDFVNNLHEVFLRARASSDPDMTSLAAKKAAAVASSTSKKMSNSKNGNKSLAPGGGGRASIGSSLGGNSTSIGVSGGAPVIHQPLPRSSIHYKLLQESHQRGGGGGGVSNSTATTNILTSPVAAVAAVASRSARLPLDLLNSIMGRTATSTVTTPALEPSPSSAQPLPLQQEQQQHHHLPVSSSSSTLSSPCLQPTAITSSPPPQRHIRFSEEVQQRLILDPVGADSPLGSLEDEELLSSMMGVLVAGEKEDSFVFGSASSATTTTATSKSSGNEAVSVNDAMTQPVLSESDSDYCNDGNDFNEKRVGNSAEEMSHRICRKSRVGGGNRLRGPLHKMYVEGEANGGGDYEDDDEEEEEVVEDDDDDGDDDEDEEEAEHTALAIRLRKGQKLGKVDGEVRRSTSTSNSSNISSGLGVGDDAEDDDYAGALFIRPVRSASPAPSIVGPTTTIPLPSVSLKDPDVEKVGWGGMASGAGSAVILEGGNDVLGVDDREDNSHFHHHHHHHTHYYLFAPGGISGGGTARGNSARFINVDDDGDEDEDEYEGGGNESSEDGYGAAHRRRRKANDVDEDADVSQDSGFSSSGGGGGLSGGRKGLSSLNRSSSFDKNLNKQTGMTALRAVAAEAAAVAAVGVAGGSSSPVQRYGAEGSLATASGDGVESSSYGNIMSSHGKTKSETGARGGNGLDYLAAADHDDLGIEYNIVDRVSDMVTNAVDVVRWTKGFLG